MFVIKRQSPQEIERIAAEWVVRSSAGLSMEEQAAFSDWLAAEPRHLGAYARAEAILAHLDRIGGAGADVLRRGDASSLSVAKPRITKRQAILGGSSLVAGFAAAGGAFVWLPKLIYQEGYSTDLGETKKVVLSDGSLLTLNTASKVVVHYSREERRVVLTEGEALFDVVKNKSRPFIVSAGDTQVRAVGTSFTVEQLPQGPVRVLVSEGVVEVKRPQVPEAAPVRLSENTIAVAPFKAPISTEKITAIQVKRDLAWREGLIAFDNETLSDAAREFFRYSDMHILVSAELENQTITGLFVSSDPAGFARAAALSLDLQVDISKNEIRLSKAGGR
jgi:transmembrane sensor